MNDERNIQIKFVIDSNLNGVFRKILKIKKITIQSVLENLLKDYVYNNLIVILESQSQK